MKIYDTPNGEVLDETPLTGERSNVQGQNVLRLKVAELCGWEFPVDLPAQRAAFTGYRFYGPDLGSAEEAEVIPNYPSDLNACAEFEKMLTEEQRYDYIALVLGKSWGDVWTSGDAFNLCHATAEQRCRAFVAAMEASSVGCGNDKQPVVPVK